ncbi:CPBP family intramembrane metalloprotease [Eubacteriales bacterium OttesenSCG-928-A19]|nr:CPBP family intramembrane metalloprotease [Eubacteriales bacterium OttesenSCG-928-A19]
MTKRPSTMVALLFTLFALAGLLAYSWLPAFLYFGLGYSPGSQTEIQLITTLYQVVIFALPTAIYYLARPAVRPALRLRGFDPLSALLIVLAAAVGVYALNWVSTYWSFLLRSLGYPVQSGMENAPGSLSSLSLMFVFAAIVPSISEELLLRGLLLPSLEQTGRKRAVIITGVAFALLHGRLQTLPTHVLLGVALGALVISTGSILSSMLYHLAYNGTALVVAYMIVRQGDAQAQQPATLEGLVRSLPLAVASLLVWGLLCYLAMYRGKTRQKNPLPPVERSPLASPVRALLVLTVALLVAYEVYNALMLLQQMAA